ncbi:MULTISPECIES: MFS transporter [Arthrobacter]|uniref:MFS transporter n=1 Tax=Arthrobacter nanjingensis TaxID=1387716 RepID=A0ABU9KKM6_9MICC
MRDPPAPRRRPLPHGASRRGHAEPRRRHRARRRRRRPPGRCLRRRSGPCLCAPRPPGAFLPDGRHGEAIRPPPRPCGPAMNTILRSATTATFVVFGINGLVFASWASRIPAVAATLGLSPGEIGGLLLCMAVGSLTALPSAGWCVNRIGVPGTIRLAGLIAALAVSGIAVGLAFHSVPVTGVSLVFTGMGIGLWDVAQNIEGADVEHRLGRTIMPQFHAAFSGGAFLGALLGAGLSAAGVPLPAHMAGIAVLVLVMSAVAPRYFLPHEPEPEHGKPAGDGLFAWKELRTLLIGVVVMGATLSEGAGNDWIAKGVVDGLRQTESTGALVFAVFVGGMTAFRVLGARLIDRFGRVVALRASMVAAAVGLLLFCWSPELWSAVLGAVLWGAGVALTFPMGMSAAADDPRRAASRVSVVSTVGYIAFLAGPPVLGFLADHLGVRNALLFIGVPIVLAAVLAGAARPLAVERTPSRGEESV